LLKLCLVFLFVAKQEYVDAQNSLGSIYYEGKGIPENYAEAIKLWKLAAEHGHEGAQYNLDNYA
jgi:TPR repeat protein